MISPFFIIIGVIVLITLLVIAMYNKLIKGHTRVEEAWADIDVQLKRRFDLIPNLVETVKGYQTHEQETLTKITEARNLAQSAHNIGERAAAEDQLSKAMLNLFAVSENYPDLKASTNFLEIQRELTDTENKVQAARRFYNGLVRDFNISVRVFPTNLLAKGLGFTEAELFEITNATEREPVAVKF